MRAMKRREPSRMWRLARSREWGRRILGPATAALFLLCGPVDIEGAQDPAAKAGGPQGDVQSLSAHYRFMERYSNDPAKADMLNQYRVGTRERVKITSDRAEGAPEVNQLEVQTIYAEQVARLSKEGQVVATVRSYTAANQKSTVEQRPFKPKLLEGLSILYQLQPGVAPLIISLTPSRRLRQPEYQAMTQQTFLPALPTILPRQPVRVGDTWAVPRIAAWALLGSPPSEDGFDLSGELVSVRKNPPGGQSGPEGSMTAVLGIKGQCLVEQGPSGINGVLHFTFKPAPAAADPSARGRSLVPAAGEPAAGKIGEVKTIQGHFDAAGFISKISLAQEITKPQSDGEGRLKDFIRREILLERRLSAAGDRATLPVTEPFPAPTVENSWLVYDDPEGRFHMLHPQEMMIVRQYPDGGIDLLDRRADGQDVITVNLLPKTGDPQRDRLAADPVQEKKRLDDEWKRRGEKVLPSHSDGWLPDADWKRLNRKVYRIEAALMARDDPAGPASGRIYLDQYIVQFSRGANLKVRAMTTRDPHVPFREKAEALIKNFNLGPSEGAAPAASSRPAGASPPASR